MTDSTPAASSPAHRTVSPGLTGTLRGFFYAAAALALGAAIATVNEVRQFDKVANGGFGSFGRLADAEEASAGLSGLFALCGLVLAVLTIIWWYQAYSAVERTGATGRSWSAGWAIGGWFIPLANFVIPKLVLNEIDRISSVAAEGSGEWRSRRLLPTANLWWAALVAAAIPFFIGTTIAGDQLEQGVTNDNLYSTALWLTAVGFAFYAVAALFAAASIRVFGSRLTRLSPKLKTGVVP